MSIEEALRLINAVDNKVAKVNWAEVTNYFQGDLITDIYDGIQDERLFTPVKQLMVAQWNKLVAAQDEHVGSWLNGEFEPSQDVEQYIDSIISKIEYQRKAEQALIDVQNQIKETMSDIRKTGVSDCDGVNKSTDNNLDCRDLNQPDTIWERSVRIESEHAQYAMNYADKVGDMLEELKEQAELMKGALRMMKGQGDISRNLYTNLLDECNSLKEENEILKTELDKANKEIDSLLPNYELYEPTQEEIDYMAEMDAEIAALEKEQFDRAVDKAVGELKKESVRITELTKKLLDYPTYEAQIQAFNVLSYLLADNKAWQEVAGSLTNQITNLANERKQQEKKLADQLNIVTGQDAKVEYTKPTK